MVNNSKEWKFLRDRILADIGAIIMISVMEGKTTDAVIQKRDYIIDYVKQFIKYIRKKDNRELIKMFPTDEMILKDGCLNSALKFKQAIKDYYNK